MGALLEYMRATQLDPKLMLPTGYETQRLIRELTVGVSTVG
jgi:hypothetical protein